MAKKKLLVVLIPRKDDGGNVQEPYRIMEEILKLPAHEHLKKARIAIAWNLSWKPDADERLVLGKCKKGADLERQMHGFDFVILLNKDIWQKSLEKFGNKLKRALMDHELCHAQVCRDSDGEIKKDDQGRICYRIRKHDLEEFREIIERHGIWKGDIAAFAKSLLAKAREPLLDESSAAEAT